MKITSILTEVFSTCQTEKRKRAKTQDAEADGDRTSYITESGLPDLRKMLWGTHFARFIPHRMIWLKVSFPTLIAGLTNTSSASGLQARPIMLRTLLLILKNPFPDLVAGISSSVESFTSGATRLYEGPQFE